jgi:hypothetical protein
MDCKEAALRAFGLEHPKRGNRQKPPRLAGCFFNTSFLVIEHSPTWRRLEWARLGLHVGIPVRPSRAFHPWEICMLKIKSKPKKTPDLGRQLMKLGKVRVPLSMRRRKKSKPKKCTWLHNG